MKKVMTFLLQRCLLFLSTVVAAPFLSLFFGSTRICPVGLRKLNRWSSRGIILVLWHENMLVPLWALRNWKIWVLVSQHFDGEIIARVLHSIGYRTIRGSSTRGGREAYYQMRTRITRDKIMVAITPDGPLGPRRKAKLGAVKLASETGAVIIPLGVASSRCKQLPSWDRFRLILPFSRNVLYLGKPLIVPPGLTVPQMKSYLPVLEAHLNQSDKSAEKWLRG